MTTRPERPPAYHEGVTPPEQPLIEAAGVTKRYGQVTALDDVSATVTSPALGLLGANGAGKSTFMKSMLGLVKPDSGQVRVLGMDAAHQAREIRRLLGYMPENMCLPLGMTARDFIVHMGELRGLPRRVAVLRASEVLFQVGLEEERSRLIRTFSIGMRQRTNLAQAIVHSPSLVILDEPTNGLDPAGREEMLALVRRLSAELGIAVIMSSHVLEDVVRTCDAVVVLRDGRVAGSRTLADASGASEARHALSCRATRRHSPPGSRPPASRPRCATTTSSSRARTPTPCSGPCATRPPTPMPGCASCARPARRSRMR